MAEPTEIQTRRASVKRQVRTFNQRFAQYGSNLQGYKTDREAYEQRLGKFKEKYSKYLKPKPGGRGVYIFQRPRPGQERITQQQFKSFQQQSKELQTKSTGLASREKELRSEYNYLEGRGGELNKAGDKLFADSVSEARFNAQQSQSVAVVSNVPPPIHPVTEETVVTDAKTGKVVKTINRQWLSPRDERLLSGLGGSLQTESIGPSYIPIKAEAPTQYWTKLGTISQPERRIYSERGAIVGVTEPEMTSGQKATQFFFHSTPYFATSGGWASAAAAPKPFGVTRTYETRTPKWFDSLIKRERPSGQKFTIRWKGQEGPRTASQAGFKVIERRQFEFGPISKTLKPKTIRAGEATFRGETARQPSGNTIIQGRLQYKDFKGRTISSKRVSLRDTTRTQRTQRQFKDGGESFDINPRYQGRQAEFVGDVQRGSDIKLGGQKFQTFNVRTEGINVGVKRLPKKSGVLSESILLKGQKNLMIGENLLLARRGQPIPKKTDYIALSRFRGTRVETGARGTVVERAARPTGKPGPAKYDINRITVRQKGFEEIKGPKITSDIIKEPSTNAEIVATLKDVYTPRTFKAPKNVGKPRAITQAELKTLKDIYKETPETKPTIKVYEQPKTSSQTVQVLEKPKTRPKTYTSRQYVGADEAGAIVSPQVQQMFGDISQKTITARQAQFQPGPIRQQGQVGVTGSAFKQDLSQASINKVQLKQTQSLMSRQSQKSRLNIRPAEIQVRDNVLRQDMRLNVRQTQRQTQRQSQRQSTQLRSPPVVVVQGGKPGIPTPPPGFGIGWPPFGKPGKKKKKQKKGRQGLVGQREFGYAPSLEGTLYAPVKGKGKTKFTGLEIRRVRI